ncbi:MAG: hypothetical protein E6P95_03855 [Candidatus Moraniibacteriota bacterium]|nr:MAG: hypothetical protein E6P95_03855 [Candidatus Moranbacteria bacterium]
MVFLLFPVGVRAADFTLTPMLQEVTVGDEAEKTIEVKITNTTDGVGTFRINTFDFGSLDESGGVVFLGASQNLEDKYGLAAWLRLDKEMVTLRPGNSEIVAVHIENQASLAPGGHYGALVFESDSQDVPESNGIAIHQKLAALIFVKKIGGAHPALELQGVEYTKSPFFLNKTMAFRFHNPGNVHVVPRGTMSVTDPFGRMVYRGILNQASALVLPESTRLLHATLFGVVPAFIPGRYTLTVQYRFEEEGEAKVWQEHLFLAPPLSLGSIVSFLVFSGTLFFWYRRQKRKI